MPQGSVDKTNRSGYQELTGDNQSTLFVGGGQPLKRAAARISVIASGCANLLVSPKSSTCNTSQQEGYQSSCYKLYKT